MFLPRAVVLRDGATLSLRTLVPDDEPRLRAWFCGLSEQSRYHRFGGHVGDLSAAQWQYLTNIDGVRHVAVIAESGGDIVGIARLIRLHDREDVAEVAFLVDDELQRRGLGSVLRDAMLAFARARGYGMLVAYVLPNNHAIRRLLVASAMGAFSVADRGDRIEVTLRPTG